MKVSNRWNGLRDGSGSSACSELFGKTWESENDVGGTCGSVIWSSFFVVLGFFSGLAVTHAACHPVDKHTSVCSKTSPVYTRRDKRLQGLSNHLSDPFDAISFFLNMRLTYL